MRFPKISILFCFFLLPLTAVSQYIQVDDSYSAQQLVEDVLIDSPCANVSNFAVSGDNFSNGEQSYGYFNAGSSAFPFADGIVISTSRASRTEGPNNNLIDEGSINWTGDSDLEQALGIGTTYNATVLEFDFTPLTSHISFDYIFASEEYQGSAPCQYSDGFAFLLKPVGSAGPYQNLALIPNTNTPVLVTTVHPAVPNCGAQNEMYFGGYNSSSAPINLNGQTVVLTASANVTPGITYHIKLVIADEQNIRYDSAIFLGGGSFQVGTDLGPDRLIATNNPVCFGETITLEALEPGLNTYQWFKDGGILAGEINPDYSVSAPGTYTVEINLGGNGCIATGEVVIEYVALPVLNDPTVLVQCDDNGDGISIFDLTAVNNIVTMGNSQLSPVVYYQTIADAQNESNPITNPSAYSNASGSSVIARTTNTFGCANFATVDLQISNNPLFSPSAIEQCDSDGNLDGMTGFDLNVLVTPMLSAGLPTGVDIDYYISENNAITQTASLPNLFYNTVPLQQTIYARILNGPDCYGIIPVNLIVHTFNPDDFDDETFYLCVGGTQQLAVANIFSQYIWSNGEIDTATITVDTPGIYTVTVANSFGCTQSKTFNVVISEIATVISVDINDFTGNENTVLVNYSGTGSYEFSIDGINFQSSALFTNVASGEYQLVVNDINGCGSTLPYSFYVMDYPKYFTPNGDGFHDIWKIKYLETQPRANVSIFDRYGRFLYSFNGDGLGWNGKSNTVDLPSSDYWFVIVLENGRVIKSHFSLKR